MTQISTELLQEAKNAADTQFRHTYLQLQHTSKLMKALRILETGGEKALSDEQRILIENFLEQRSYW